MLSFENDYSCTATPEIIERISEIAQNQYPGYGNDSICESAKAKIREACACPDAQIFFLVGGTQTNQTIIDSITPQYAGVIAASTGHVNVHEAGAIEFTGHKVLTLPHHDGKIDATELDEYCATFYADGNYTHMVFPGCVYISQATEYGTLYTLAELEAIRKVCTKYDMPLFIDGARLGYALTATGNDVTLEDIARIADVFYIGGTKVGAMFGEAVVFTHGNMPQKLRDARQATWRAARQGMAAGRAVRHAVHRRSVLQDRPPRQRCGRPYSRSAGGTWLYAHLRRADQSDLHHARQRDIRAFAAQCAPRLHGKWPTTRTR